MAKGNKKKRDNSIAGRIKNTMVKSSTICLAAQAVGLNDLVEEFSIE